MTARLLITAVLAWLVAAGGAAAEKRVALVIGNGAYRTLGALANPAADARGMGELLRGTLRFEVIAALDADHAAMLKALADFGKAAADADIAVVFYAGHGVQVNGRNYLIPVGADIASQVDLPTQAIKLDDVGEILEASGAKAKILLIDACRNNPLPASATRSATRGLARLDASAVGTLIAFATAPDKVAADGRADHSPFTAALLARLGEPGREIRQALGKVREDTYAATNREQAPWVNEALLGEIYLAGKAADAQPADAGVRPAPPQADAATAAADMAACAQIDDEAGRLMLEAYLDRHPDGYCAKAVRRRLAELAPAGKAHSPPADAGAGQDAAAAPAPAYRVSSTWDHNGSVVALSASGQDRLFYYQDPRPVMAQRGVRRGTLLFKGSVAGDSYRGLAYVFSRDCGPLSYPVSGEVSPDRRRVVLRGRVPKRAADCRQTGWLDDTLVFDYRAKSR